MDSRSWDIDGDLEMTEHWRTVVPDLAVDVAADRTGVDNDCDRATAVRQRYVLELKHLTGAGSTFVTSSVTRLSDWLPLTPEERDAARHDSALALARGVPSRAADEPSPPSGSALDFAVLVVVPARFFPRGPLSLDGVPLVVARFQAFQPLGSDSRQKLSAQAS